MKKCKQLLLTVLLGFMSVPALAQSTFPNNLRPAGVAFLGWDGVGINPGSLEIRNNFATQPINFFTAGVQMMTLSGTSGFAGIGANLLTYTPVSFLDVPPCGI